MLEQRPSFRQHPQLPGALCRPWLNKDGPGSFTELKAHSLRPVGAETNEVSATQAFHPFRAGGRFPSVDRDCGFQFPSPVLHFRGEHPLDELPPKGVCPPLGTDFTKRCGTSPILMFWPGPASRRWRFFDVT